MLSGRVLHQLLSHALAKYWARNDPYFDLGSNVFLTGKAVFFKDEAGAVGSGPETAQLLTRSREMFFACDKDNCSLRPILP